MASSSAAAVRKCGSRRLRRREIMWRGPQVSISVGDHAAREPAEEYASYRCRCIDYKIAKAGMAPGNMELQGFNCRAKNHSSGAQNPLASNVSRSEQKSSYQKYGGMFAPVWNGRIWSKVRRHHREHDNDDQGGTSRQPTH
jgi:hypothetical protein